MSLNSTLLFENRALRYGGALNSYDLLKCLALLVMTIDHLGTYLWPDVLWPRAIGRCAFPIWLFLAGYSAHFTLRRDVALGAIVITLLCAALPSENMLPLKILVAILAVRLTLGWLDARGILARAPMSVLAAGIVLSLFTVPLVEYGSLSLLFAAMGYYHYRKHRGFSITVFTFASWAAYLGWQLAYFPEFKEAEILLMLLGCTGVALLLWRFHLREECLHAAHPLTPPLRWLSRNSLYYYVGHLLLLMPLYELRA